MRTKYVTFVLLTVFSALALSGCYEQGSLYSKVSSRTLPAGDFLVHWSNPGEGKAFVAVRHRSNPGRVLWATEPGQNFLRAIMADIDVKEHRGSFTVKDDERLSCAFQSVDDIRLDGAAVTITGRLADAKAQNGASYVMTFRQASGGHLRFEASVAKIGCAGEFCARAFNQIEISYASSSNEKFYGFGEQFTHLNLKGHRVPIISQEGGVGRGREPVTSALNLVSPGSGGDAYTSYISVPHYITSLMRSLFLETTEYAVFDLRDDESVSVKIFSDRIAGRILYGATPLELIERYTEYAGRMKALPDWIGSGAIVGMQGGTERVYEIWNLLEAQGTPIAAFWLQDWVGKRKTMIGSQLWWNWELDAQTYPEWDGLVAAMHEADIRAMGYINSFLVDASLKGSFERNLYREAVDGGFLVMNENNQPYPIKNTDFDAGMVDLSNPAARAWIKSVIKEEMLARGFSGWMLDFAEALPFDAVIASGDAASYHNQYPVEWAKINQEAIAELGLDDEIVFFNRSGYTKSPGASTLFWEGDQMVTWDGDDGLKSAIKGLVSGGFSGFSLNHSDIGGYTSVSLSVLNIFKREKELLMRWMEANAFTAAFRTHEGNEPEKNAQFYSDADTLAQFTRFAKVFRALGFYRAELMRDAEAKGWPLVRHMLLHYPNDPAAYDLKYQFMLGADFIVAPVVDKRAESVRCYLPAGEWVHVWTGASCNAGWVDVGAPMGKPAVFFKKGSPAGSRFVRNLRGEGVL
ncbi:MAG TPA: alpha-glucosidase [Spirochaetota bacterium]|nr:alpha-glucosidase [Spirochaetota bacterium]HNT12146.1 alpha-glucosidase [Spirochaetota bacterium]